MLRLRFRRALSCLFPSLLVSEAASCADRVPEAAWDATSRDSSGVALVVNHGAPLWDETARWHLKETLRIGVGDGPAEYMFGSSATWAFCRTPGWTGRHAPDARPGESAGEPDRGGGGTGWVPGGRRRASRPSDRSGWTVNGCTPLKAASRHTCRAARACRLAGKTPWTSCCSVISMAPSATPPGSAPPPRHHRFSTCFDREGHYLGQVPLPGGFWPRRLHAGRLYGRWRDSLDFEYVKVLEIDCGTPAGGPREAWFSGRPATRRRLRRTG
jgi:hypothetical protein